MITQTDGFLPIRHIAQTQTACKDSQNEANLLYWNQPVSRTHQIPLKQERDGSEQIQ